MNNERWFESSKYNITRVIEKLAETVETLGGIVEDNEELIVHTRGYMEPIQRVKDTLDRVWKDKGGTQKEQRVRANAIIALLDDLEALQKKEAEAPVIRTKRVTLISDVWIRFKLDGYEYTFSAEDNPFFPDHYSKTKIGTKEVYRDEIECGNKKYFPDEMWSPVASEEVINRSAIALLEQLKGLGSTDQEDNGKEGNKT